MKMKEIKIEKKKVVFEQTPPEEMCSYEYELRDEFEMNGGVICGNKDFVEFGDEKLISIVKNDYEDSELGYDYEVLDELKKVTGREYEEFEILGYCQGDWNYVYLPKKETNRDYINWIEAMYFGMFDEYWNEDYWTIPIIHKDSWKGNDSIKEAIACETGLSVDEITLRNFTGYKKIAQFEEV